MSLNLSLILLLATPSRKKSACTTIPNSLQPACGPSKAQNRSLPLPPGKKIPYSSMRSRHTEARTMNISIKLGRGLAIGEKTIINIQKELSIGSNLSVRILLTSKYNLPLTLDKAEARKNNQVILNDKQRRQTSRLESRDP